MKKKQKGLERTAKGRAIAGGGGGETDKVELVKGPRAIGPLFSSKFGLLVPFPCGTCFQPAELRTL